MNLNYGDFTYEIDFEESRHAIKKILGRLSNEELVDLILTLDIYDELEEVLHDEIAEYYHDEAWGNHRDNERYQNDPYGYYGVSERDFL